MIIQSWIIAGLVIGCLALILFVVLGEVNSVNTIAAIVAFTLATILLAVKRVLSDLGLHSE
ncbi:MAG: hypothetical protein HZB51_15515 [Chloroflexi bacterium]|nr:hypothetical protein [Chloroflexota bacterium]